MSGHHKAQKWTTHSPKLRAQLAPMLPLPCVNCGRPVLPEHKWQVGHRTDAARGGRPTIENVGPVHCKTPGLWFRNCNQIAGGKLSQQMSRRRRGAPERDPRLDRWTR